MLGGTTTLADCLVAVRHLIGRDGLVSGDTIPVYEDVFASTTGVRYGVSFAAGRVGLYGLLRALRIEPNDEVLLQVPSHVVVANAIRYVGARPIYVDCDPRTYNIDLADAETKVSDRTRVLLVQHTFGVPADMDAVTTFAERHGLEIIEDCVHALGATYGGRPVGSFGRAAMFSTEETKIITTTLGGMVVTDDAPLAVDLRNFQAQCSWPEASLAASHLVKLVLFHALTRPSVHRAARAAYHAAGRRSPLPRAMAPGEELGEKPPDYEQRLSNGQASVGLRQLRRLDANVSHRREIAETYARALPADARVEIPPAAEPSFLRYPVWVRDRDEALRAASGLASLGTWFSSVLEDASSPDVADYQHGSCPHAEAAARHLVNLPTHGHVTRDDAQALAAVVAPFVTARTG